jgi:RNA polymerase sigma-70 factor (sigma-E family)
VIRSCGRLLLVEPIGGRLRGALLAWCPRPAWLTADVPLTIEAVLAPPAIDTDAFVEDMFRVHGLSLLKLARLFVDDRNAAEDLVQEAFIRLARSASRIEDASRAPAYLRSIVLNLARDHNRRGLVSLRHRSPLDDRVPGVDDEVTLRDDQRRVLDALRDLPDRQRACLVLRYYDELGVDEIADNLGISRNSVKTHLQRGLAALEAALAEPAEVDW